MWNKTSLGLVAGTSLAGYSQWIDFLAILTLSAFVLGASPAEMALVSATLLLPGMLLGSAIGRWLDGVNPGPALLAALGLRSCSTLLLLADLSLVPFCLLLTVRSIASIPVEPAISIVVARAVPAKHVARYFGTLGLLRNLAKLTAPVLGAGIATWAGERAAIGLSVLLSGLALACLLVTLRSQGRWLAAAPPAPMPDTPRADHRPEESAPSPDTLPARQRLLFRQLACNVTLYAFMVNLINHQLPVLLNAEGFDKGLVGVLMSCSGAGGILAAAWLSRVRPAADPLRATVVSIMGIAACFVALGLAFTLPPMAASLTAACLFVATGAFSTVEAVRAQVVVVQEFPGAVGSVTGRLASLQSGAMLVAPWVAAAALPHVSTSALFVADGVCTLLALVTVNAVLRQARERAAFGTKG